MTTTSQSNQSMQDAASSAAEEGKHVAEVAKDEAQKVAAEARSQARGLLDDAMTQVQDQSRTQRDQLVGTLQTFSDDLERMADQGGGSGLAAEVARQVADRARTFGNRIQDREPTDLLDDLRAVARRRPGLFLAGALAAGVVAGRLARGLNQAREGSNAPQQRLGSPYTDVGDPAALPVAVPGSAPTGVGDPLLGAPGGFEGGTTP